MNIRNVVIVLGKRLVDDTLTKEGRSRVEALPALLSSLNDDETALVFCGGVTPGQTVSEAVAMREYFNQSASQIRLKESHVILESESQNTVQNIHNVALKLQQMGLNRQPINITLVSNDYHLKRIFEVQQLMNEQGLLRALKQRCNSAGLDIKIDMDIRHHCSVEYPHREGNAEAFLLVDELTTYRVYLEGATNNAFQRPLERVRCVPAELALHSLSQLDALKLSDEVQEKLTILKEIVLSTTSDVDGATLRSSLARFHHNLTWLNRHLDPEMAAMQST
ncbi:YdcF family protein [Vibrio sp. Isolate25]|uniref:YdcF family protein n=1 Tax=unclassified Vibrio TaxID=2614977 RepID=UPI001EFDA1B7|nr:MULTISPECIES: YdcF family protein [unclassified Vibrio]MCG9595849.1 YdcF family protein [Vibrio sp. Isolate25]MCG9677346.1 YdcF family protein [Vibrio sp. Isolate24]